MQLIFEDELVDHRDTVGTHLFVSSSSVVDYFYFVVVDVLCLANSKILGGNSSLN